MHFAEVVGGVQALDTVADLTQLVRQLPPDTPLWVDTLLQVPARATSCASCYAADSLLRGTTAQWFILFAGGSAQRGARYGQCGKT